MLSKKECEEKMSQYLRSSFSGEEFAISGDQEHSWGWVFFYETKAFVEGLSDDPLFGNAPIIINKYTGEFVVTGTAKPIEKYIQEYEKHMKKTEGLSLSDKLKKWESRVEKPWWKWW